MASGSSSELIWADEHGCCRVPRGALCTSAGLECSDSGVAVLLALLSSHRPIVWFKVLKCPRACVCKWTVRMFCSGLQPAHGVFRRWLLGQAGALQWWWHPAVTESLKPDQSPSKRLLLLSLKQARTLQAKLVQHVCKQEQVLIEIWVSGCPGCPI